MIAIIKGATIPIDKLGDCEIAGVQQTGHRLHYGEHGYYVRRVFTVYVTSRVDGFHFMRLEIEESSGLEIVCDE